VPGKTCRREVTLPTQDENHNLNPLVMAQIAPACAGAAKWLNENSWGHADVACQNAPLYALADPFDCAPQPTQLRWTRFPREAGLVAGYRGTPFYVMPGGVCSFSTTFGHAEAYGDTSYSLWAQSPTVDTAIHEIGHHGFCGPKHTGSYVRGVESEYGPFSAGGNGGPFEARCAISLNWIEPPWKLNRITQTIRLAPYQGASPPHTATMTRPGGGSYLLQLLGDGSLVVWWLSDRQLYLGKVPPKGKTFTDLGTTFGLTADGAVTIGVSP
jgi:hypothetical protein